MRVLVTGNVGYIGTIFSPMLIEAGHEVVGLDSDLYSRCTFAAGGRLPDMPTVSKDTRDVAAADLAGFDGVIHLAALSNDPLGNLNSSLTDDVNHRASVRLADLPKRSASPASCLLRPAATTVRRAKRRSMRRETSIPLPLMANRR